MMTDSIDIGLEQSDFPYKSLFETSIDGILLVTMTGMIFAANPAACDILGRMPGEIAGSPLDSVLDEADPRTRAAFTDLYNTGEFHGELSFLKPSTLGAYISMQPTQVTDVLNELMSTGKLPGDINLLHADSPSFPAEVSCTVHDTVEHGKRISIIFKDATERLQMLEALRELAIRDELTGLYNRREMMNLLQNSVRHAALHQGTVSLIMGDIDHFKDVNDTYGHQTGDQVLKEVALLIHRRLRSTDSLARYGGEEFSIILPEATGPEAARVAEIARIAVATHTFRPQSQRKNLLPIRVTISLGVASFPVDALSEHSLISAADKALYKAKHQGRNRVVAYGTNPLAVEPGSRG